MSENYNISSSPHVRSKVTTGNIMLMVIIALLPATAFGIVNFGLSALLVVLVTVASSVLTEYLYQKLMHRKVTISDCSAVVTGLLLALNMPPTAPWWMCVLGSVFAILVVKQVFGGLGQNFMNPALGARCFLLISFTGRMTTFVYDGVTGATPLALLKAGEKVNVFDMFLGNIGGTIGETSVVAILIGAIFLLAKGIIDIRIPASYILTFSVFVLIFGGFDVTYLAAHLCGGGLMLGAWFMATDYVTCPITPNGKILFGICLGILTGVFRLFGGSAEGVSYATAILTVITLVAGILLGLVYDITKEPIALAKEKAKNEPYQAVMKDADTFEQTEVDGLVELPCAINEAVIAKAGEEVVGYVVTVTTSEGYGGVIQVSIGIAVDGTVKGIEMLSISETAGLGMNANTPEFKAQYADVLTEEFVVTKTGATAENEIDAISGATITSNAVTNAVNSAIAYFNQVLGGSVNE